MYQVIKLDGFLEEVADVTEGPYARKFCFFLGAGASITSGIPAATKLVDLWDEKIRTRFPAEEYEQWKNEKKLMKTTNTVITAITMRSSSLPILSTDTIFLKRK